MTNTSLAALLVLTLAVPLLALGEQPPAFNPTSMAYVLQGDSFAKKKPDAVKKLAECGRDLVVVDYSHSGAADGKWTVQEVDAIRKGKAGRKVVAYLSIGEAEDYRPYWKKEWARNGKPTAGAAAFLHNVNPEWQGNYKVRYWHKDWQKLILAYLDQILEQGFDGVYLDIVDGFEFFEYDPQKKVWIDNRKNPETDRTYRAEMIDWVRTIADHARKKKPGFLVIPQNGSQLLDNADFVKTVDAIGIEDLFTDGKKKQPDDHVKPILANLQKLQKAGKPVLLIEYPTAANLKKLVTDSSKQHKLVLVLTDRELKTLGKVPSP